MRSAGVMMSVRRMPNLSFYDDDLALGDQGAIDEHVHRLAGEAIELDLGDDEYARFLQIRQGEILRAEARIT